MEEQPAETPAVAPEPRGLSVRLDPADAAELRAIAVETDSKVRDVLAVLAFGCSQAIRSGSLRRSIVQRKMQALQAMAGLPEPQSPAYQEPPYVPAEAPRVAGVRIPTLNPLAAGSAEPPPAAPDPLVARRTYA